MKKLLSLKYLTVLLFSIFLFFFLVKGVGPFLNGVKAMGGEFRKSGIVSTATIDTWYNDALPAKVRLITLNGGLQRILGKREVNNVFLLDDGQLTTVNWGTDVEGYASNMTKFRDVLEKMNIPMIFVSAPFKLESHDERLPDGVEDLSNETMDHLIECLRENHVDVLDLRERIKEEGLTLPNMFFRTDHHWTPESGFWAATEIENYLARLDGSFSVDPAVQDINNYSLSVYKDVFLGSHGRRTGPSYAGYDDITLIEPQFATAFSVEGVNRQEGTFSEALLHPEKIDSENPFYSASYNAYGSTDGLLKIKNLSSERNFEIRSTPKKILFLKDSFGIVTAPFLSLGYDTVWAMDLRQYDGELMEVVEEFRPDIVCIQYYPGVFASKSLFSFLPEE